MSRIIHVRLKKKQQILFLRELLKFNQRIELIYFLIDLHRMISTQLRFFFGFLL